MKHVCFEHDLAILGPSEIHVNSKVDIEGPQFSPSNLPWIKMYWRDLLSQNHPFTTVEGDTSDKSCQGW